MLKKEEKSTVLFLMRQVIYFALLTLCSVGMWRAAKIYHSALVEEYGFIENIQVILLVLTAGIFAFWAGKYSKERVLSLFLMTLPLTAACRELDAFFDGVLPIIGWQFSLFFLLIAGIYVLLHWADFRKSFIKFLNSPAFYLMFSTMIMIIPIAQCIGHKSFIVDVIGNATDARIIRRLFEESIELEGYLLILFSSLEYYFSQLRSKK